MNLKLSNTLTAKQEPLKTLDKNSVKMYTCGLTVYSQPHIGNWVYFIFCDILHRTLLANDYEVKRVQNITDVGHLTDDGDDGEDKMQKGALREGKTAWDVAKKYIELADYEAYDLLGLLRPTDMPRATDFILQQIDFVRQLEVKGFAYVIADGVYFDTSKLSDYGKLARLDIEGLQFGARVADTGKKNPTDFALWKLSNPAEKRDMEWQSPWGMGFPGWHLECSVMARELLGDQIDIHTGGIDHIPVHHTNEIAQTEAMTGKQFSQFWLHSNHLKINSTKISKSLGNGYTLSDIIDKDYDIQAFKLLVLSKHYKTEGNFTWEILDAATNRLKKWQQIATLRHQTHDTLDNDDSKSHDGQSLLATPHAIKEALNDDLNTPKALAIIDEAFGRLESMSLNKIHRQSLFELLKRIDKLLGIDLIKDTPDVSDEIKQLILERQRAREASDWTRSDELRDELAAHGITIRDSAGGSIWTYL